jgi:hypothetical protein
VCSFGNYESHCYGCSHSRLCANMLSFFYGRYLGEELLGHMARVCLAFKETAKLFSKVAVLPYHFETEYCVLCKKYCAKCCHININDSLPVHTQLIV